MKNKEKLPPKDSWIRLNPGEGFQFNADIQELWIQKARELRRIRGDILAISFQLEYILDEIIAEMFFPGLSIIPSGEIGEDALQSFASSTVLKELFSRLFLKTTNSQLGRKIDILNNLTNELQFFGKLVPDALKADIKRSAEIRNLFAHYPAYFEMVGDEHSQDLKAMYIVKGEKVELTKMLCDEYKAQLSLTAENLAQVQKQLQEITIRIDEGEAVDLGGTIWIGHIALDVDEWEVRDAKNPINVEDIYLFATKKDLTLNLNAHSDDDSEPSKD
jgi:hypothetical protein